jgi:hypothetical protein
MDMWGWLCGLDDVRYDAGLRDPCALGDDQVGMNPMHQTRKPTHKVLTGRANRALTRCDEAPTKRFLGDGPVAQLVEHVTFNHVVAGSNPARLTIHASGLRVSIKPAPSNRDLGP